MKISTKYVILIAIALLIGAFLFGGYLGRKRANSALEPVIDGLNGQIRRDSIDLHGKTLYIAEVNQELKTEREARRQGDIEKEELRKLNIKHLNEITRLKLRIDTIFINIPHTGTVIEVPSDTESDRQESALLLPFGFQQVDEWLSLYGSFDIQGDFDLDIGMDVLVDIWGAYKKKEDNPSITLTSNNPYINVLEISSIKFDAPKPKRYGIGLQIGYGITREFKASPYVGVGLSYNIIRF